MSKEPKGGGPAFPTQFDYGPSGHQTIEGMTMRDWFAGQAMASLILVPATAAIARQDGNLPTKTLALAAYEAADAMLAAREK